MKNDQIIQRRVAVMIAAVILLCGCAAQKNNRPRDEKAIAEQALYTQARQALDARRFRIEFCDYHYMHGRKPVAYIIEGDNYLSMNDSITTYRIDRNPPSLSLGSSYGEVRIPAQITSVKVKKSGEIIYRLEYRLNTFIIRLFPNSNKCVVESSQVDAMLNGEVYPLMP